MKRAGLAMLVNAAMLACLAPAPLAARVESYGQKRYTQVGHADRHAERGHEHDVVIDRRRGPNWGGVVAGGILGAVAGLALGTTVAQPVYTGPPPVGSMVPALPPGCGTVPTYSGSVLYNCGGIYYQPVYEGTSMMFEIVPGP